MIPGCLRLVTTTCRWSKNQNTVPWTTLHCFSFTHVHDHQCLRTAWRNVYSVTPSTTATVSAFASRHFKVVSQAFWDLKCCSCNSFGPSDAMARASRRALTSPVYALTLFVKLIEIHAMHDRHAWYNTALFWKIPRGNFCIAWAWWKESGISAHVHWRLRK